MTETDRLADLLEVARATLKGELAPLLSDEPRYKAAMVASAMAIVARALRDGEACDDQEAAALHELYGPAGGLAALRARLAADIRSGVLDGPADHAVQVVLRARVAARLAISAGA